MTRRMSPVAVCCSSASVSSRLRALQLGDQPRILDGDDRLAGEGLEELDLPVGKEPRLLARHHDRTDGNAVLEHRHADHAAVGQDEAGPEGVVRVREGVRDLLDPAAQHRAAGGACPARRRGKLPFHGVDAFRLQPVVGDEMHELSVEAEDVAELRPAQTRRPLGDRVEDGLDVARGGNDAQNLLRRRLLLQRRVPLLDEAGDRLRQLGAGGVHVVPFLPKFRAGECALSSRSELNPNSSGDSRCGPPKRKALLSREEPDSNLRLPLVVHECYRAS